MITLLNKMKNKTGLRHLKSLLFFSFFFFLFVIVPNSVSAGQDNIGYEYFQCTRHGYNDTKVCSSLTTFFPQNRSDYTSASMDFDFSGHRHGGSSINASACLQGSNGEGSCQWFLCSGDSCGAEYGSSHPFNTYTSGNINASSFSGSGSNFWLFRTATVMDAEVRVGVSAYAIYPDAPPPPPVANPPGAFTLNPASCSGGGAISISWTPSSDASSYRIERKTWTGGTFGSLGTTNGTSYYDSNISIGATYYYRVYAINSEGETRSDPNNDNAIGASCPVPGTEGICGTANRTYPVSASSYSPDTYCEAGSASATPAFPSAGSSASWTCLGSGGALDSPQCTAVHQGGVPPPATYQVEGVLDTNNPPGTQVSSGNCTILQGWVWDPDYPNNPTSVHVYKDGVFDGYSVADNYRPDLQASGIGNGVHAFNYYIPNSWKDGANHTINVYGIDLNGNPNRDLTYVGVVTSPIVNLNCAPPAPTLNSVTISAPTVIADNTSQYDIVVSASDQGGPTNITREYALINYQGSNGGTYRGYLAWATTDIWPTHKNHTSCSLNGVAGTGGYAVIRSQGADNVYGYQYIQLDACSVIDTGSSRDVYFKVRFDPTYVAPATNNDISGHAHNSSNVPSGWQNFDINFSVAGVPTSSATISSASVNADGITPYTITISGTDPGGAGNITHLFGLINYQGSNAGSHRGYVVWYGPADAWVGQQDHRACGGVGSYGAVVSLAPNDIYGHQYIHMDSCNVTDSGNTRSIVFTVRFDPLFVTPLINNDISSYSHNIYDLTNGWVNNDINFSLNAVGAPPTVTSPTVTAITSTGATLGGNVTSLGTPPAISARGTCWGTTNPPSTNCTAAGGLTTGVYTHARTGMTANTLYYFRAYATNVTGTGYSPVSSFTTSAAAVNGVCGTANQSYPSGTVSYGSDTYCALGTPSSSPAFPPPAGSVNWTCLGSGGGSDSPQCTASVAASTFTLTVSANPGPGGRITGPGINCGVDCSETFSSGSVVTLTAVPTSSHWMFTGWSGGGCSGTGTCTVTVTANTLINATFVPRPFILIEF